MIQPQNIISVLLSLLLLSGCASIERLAIPDNQLKAQSFALTGTQESINHAAWDNFLNEYTKKDDQGVVRVNYVGVNKDDHRNLKNYIDFLSQKDASTLSKTAQLAYWSNLYNAKTIDVILENYPVNSIREIKDGFLDLGPWEDKRLNVNGQPLSLHDIEHGIVRAIWSDTPEIHYILNCAAVGCPNLSQQALTAQNVNALMDQASYEFINSSRGVHFSDDNILTISKIYSWYLGDYGGSEETILEHLKKYADPELKEKLEQKSSIDRYDYDWTLNRQK